MNSPTVILLDGHEKCFLQTVDQSIDSNIPNRSLPSYPVWTSIVDGALNYCRILWQLSSNALITVLLAGNTTTQINDWKSSDQQIDKLSQGLETFRAQPWNNNWCFWNACEDAMKKFQSQPGNHGHLVLVMMSKGPTDVGYCFQHDVGADPMDIRSVLYAAYKQNHIKMKVHVDVIRILPMAEMKSQMIEEILPGLTVILHTIPNQPNAVQSTMSQLIVNRYSVSQAHIRLNSVEQESRTMTVLYTPTGKHLNMKQGPTSRNFRAVKCSDRDTSLVRSYSCIHVATTCVLFHPSGISTLSSSSATSSAWYLYPETTYPDEDEMVLSLVKGHIYLHCINKTMKTSIPNLLIQNIVKKEEMLASRVQILITDAKRRAFIRTLVKENTYKHAFSLSSDDRLVPILAHTYSHDTFKEQAQSTKKLAQLSKWYSCIRDGFAYDGQGPELDLSLLSKIPSDSKLLSMLEPLPGLLDQPLCRLRDALVMSQLNHSLDFTALVEVIFTKCAELRSGRTKTKFAKDWAPEVGTKVMAMLYFVSVRFKEDSAYHYRVCDYIWQLLTSPVPLERLLQREYANNQPDQRPNNATDVAWDQTRKYDVMTYRERQDMMHSNVGFNPNFRGRRQAPALAKENAAPSGRDPMSAKPYLQPVNPPSWDELKKSKDSSRMIGRPGSLMQVFWSSRDSDDLTRNFDGQKPMLEE